MSAQTHKQKQISSVDIVAGLKRRNRITVLLSDHELKQVKEKAKKQHIPMSSYLRQAALMWRRAT